MKTKKSELKNYYFAIIALTLPFVFLSLAEVGLRQTTAYQNSGLFERIEANEKSWYVAQSTFGSRYFGNFYPSVALNPFLAEPDSDVFRIFVLGGSTAAGYPHSFGFGFPQQLELMLLQERPDVPVEVINLGMTAVNSYTVWDITRRLHRYSPDLLIIYSGHNEYYGAYGAGSTAGAPVWSPALNRLIIRSLDLALVQWMRHLFVRAVQPGNTPKITDSADAGLRTTTMQQMIRDSDIRLNGKKYRRGLRQFESNLNQIASITGNWRVPVVVSTVVSNLKDQPPLSENTLAVEAFHMGLTLFNEGNTEAARYQFDLARELDGLRFRAPSAINAIISEVAAKHGHFHLIDLELSVRQASSSGIEDASFFTDHLHPGADGYRLMARELMQKILPLLPAYTGEMDCTRFSREHQPDTLRLMPDSFEHYLTRLNLEILLSGYPFVRQPEPNAHSQFVRSILEEASRDGNPSGEQLAARFLMEGGHPLIYYRELLQALKPIDNPDSLTEYIRTVTASALWNPLDFTQYNDALSTILPLNPPFYELEPLLLAASAHTGNSLYYNILAALYLQNEDMNRACRFLEVTEHRIPNDPDLINNLIMFHLTDGDTLKARDYYLRAGRRAGP